MEHSMNILIDYLHDILNQPETASLHPEDLSPDFRELGENLTLLADMILQLKNDLHRQTEAVEMENQVLMDNIQAMDEISWSLEQTNQELRSNLALVNALTDYTHNMIFVYSVDTGQEVHKNQPAHWFQKAHAQTASQLIQHLVDKQPEIHQQIEQQSRQCRSSQAQEETMQSSESSPKPAEPSPENQGPADHHQNSLTWNMALDGPDGADVFYQVESFLIPWFQSIAGDSRDAKKQAIVHIVIDETERQRRQNLIYRFAYVDPLTNLNNRRYAIEKMEQWLAEGTAFTLSFVDVDYLKYCNDTFGHEEGDRYLIECSEALKTVGGEVCRVGGDEFFVLCADISPDRQDRKLEALRQTLLADRSSGHPKCFSYASSLIPVHPEAPLETYIRDTDTKMYQYKQKYKIPLSDAVYKDERTL